MLKDVSIETDRRTSLNFWNQTLEQTGGSEPADEHTEQRAKKEGRRALGEEAPHRGRELAFGERGPSPRSTCSSVTELSEEGLRPGTAQMSQRREGPWRGQHSSRRGPCWGPHSRLSSLSVSGNLSLPGARATEGERPDPRSLAAVSRVTLRAARTGASHPRASMPAA